MAKDIIFESERVERWQKAKRCLIPVAVFLVIAVIAVAATLILRSIRGAIIVAGEDTPYPYSWAVKKDGSVTLEIDRSAAPGYQWNVLESASDISAGRSRTQTAERSRFILTPEFPGRSSVTFQLTPEDGSPGAIYELTFFAETSEEDGKITTSLVSVNSGAVQGTVEGGADTAYPYRVHVDEDGDLLIAVAEAPEEGENAESATAIHLWDCVSDNEEIASVIGVISEDGEAVGYVRPGTTIGTCVLRMSDSISGAEITVECENRADGSLLVLSHSIRVE